MNHYHFLLLLLVISICINNSTSTTTTSSCPCSDESLCAPLNIVLPRQEFLGYSLYNDSFESYDWDVVTTIAIFYTPVPPELLCLAHSKGVRLVYGAEYPISQLGNQTHQDQWIQDQLQLVQSTYFDGLNFDIESPIWSNQSTTSALLTGLVAQTNFVFKNSFPFYQISVDVAWSPNCIDGRCYDYYGLAQASDYLAVMSYDMRSQVFNTEECTASANSPYMLVLEGLLNYTALGIPSDKLVLGLPWYGYIYPCINENPSLESLVCNITRVPFRGATCSDAAGSEYEYSYLMDLLSNSSLQTTGELWDDQLGSPFFNFIDPSDSNLYQVWYDNPESLSIKVAIASKLNLRGLAVWNVDFLDLQNQPTQTNMMWQVMANFFTHHTSSNSDL
ncbi:glycoside hydrolase family 18 protein [Cavenderia fasciculata]|uniref:Glycoside hydrolase family 18 protein n=1 Tax=Cavenderia fasciculata TaxID=261658 RepID=F4Q1K2_CACFS|nr:glycoside hydrolase family 18 protein [Cavenderia fasciculata]EGG18703.1 glycoside hydrolase family 18 protein [Cavenderia fasciculata]|eukprot:XP_004366607.1 glycoside hydrolase family 18 protein [Cavenderia fasciculata]